MITNTLTPTCSPGKVTHHVRSFHFLSYIRCVRVQSRFERTALQLTLVYKLSAETELTFVCWCCCRYCVLIIHWFCEFTSVF